VGQLFAVPALSSGGSAENRQLRDLVQDVQVGGIIFFQGTPLDQAALLNELQAAAPIPLLASQDMEWGAGMRLTGATMLPTAMALGATRDPDLAYRAGRVTAAEARAVGVRQVLAPVADVNSSTGNPVIDTRSFSDRPGLAAVMVDAFVRGLQDGGVLATAKHFPGHGATSRDSHFSMPVLQITPARLDSVDLVPFRAAIEAGVSSVMTAHVAYPRIDGGSLRPATLSRPLIQGLLRDSLRFEGLIVSDALNMAGVRSGATAGSIALTALSAGVDMLMMSTDVQAARRSIIRAVRAGTLSEADLDGHVRRILRAKASAGLHRSRFAPLQDVRSVVANATHRAVAARIARESITVLGDSSAGPVGDAPGRTLLLLAVSDRDSDARHEVFLGDLRERLPDVTIESRVVSRGNASSSLSELVRLAGRADDTIVASFVGASTWQSRPQTAAAFRRLINRTLTASRHFQLAVFGTPYIASAVPPGTPVYLAYGEGPAEQRALADAVTGRSGTPGRSPVTLSPSIDFGAGLPLEARYPRIAEPEEVDMDGAALSKIDSLMQAAIFDRAFPGAAIAVGRPGAVVHTHGYGYYTYNEARPVTNRSTFDLASLTKVIATTTAVMQLYEQGRIDLDAPVALYLHAFGRNGKDKVTIRQLLTHTGGLIPFRPFYSMGIRSRGRVLQAIYNEELVYEPGTEYRYSDFGPILLAEVVSRISGLGFATYATRNIFEPLGMWHTGYRPVGRGAEPEVVPTENDDYFRFRVLQGEVHDENAWIMGGVAGHAGLFSTVVDLSRFANMLIREGRVGNRQFLKAETIELFTTPADTSHQHTRALGWDTKSPEGYSSAGHFFGPRSYGHTGFTGTSIWFDPDEQLYVILLSNRVYPSRDNRGHIPVRPALADLVHETILEPALSRVAD
jgi:beta-N-acetylhexosaminidase